jgi:hypothetical protein
MTIVNRFLGVLLWGAFALTLFAVPQDQLPGVPAELVQYIRDA